MSETGTTVVATPGTPNAGKNQGHSQPKAKPKEGGGGGIRWVVGIVVLAAIGAGAFFYYGHDKPKPNPKAAGGSAGSGQGEGEGSGGGTPIETAHPKKGGIERSTTQAGSVHAFDHASLYAKISGYLKEQNVDIGDRVKRGQVLAVIEDPEIDKTVEQNAASLEQAKARVDVAKAKIRSAAADKAASDAMVTQTESDVSAKVSNHELQEKRLARIRGLVQRDAVEQKLLDEQQDQLDVSSSELGVARAAVLTAKAQTIAKMALIDSAQADLEEARSNVAIAEANLAKAKVFQDYKTIVSPYDGVVTVRSYHRGDFVRSATEGGNIPVLAVAVTNKMRIVVPVPDVDVPFVNQGDPATFHIVALPNETFHGVVSRFSETEDPQSRNMRTEVDMPNAEGKLHEGMYGRVTILLQPAAEGGVTVPSSCLVEQSGKGEGTLYVARDGKAHKVKVQVGKDNGVDAEILSGLKTEDEVIVRYNGPIEDGSPVKSMSGQVAQAGH